MKNVILVVIGIIIGFVINYPQFTEVSVTTKKEEKLAVKDNSKIVTKTITRADGTKIEYKEEKKDIELSYDRKEKTEEYKKKDKGISLSIVSKNITNTKDFASYGIIINKEIIAGVGITGCYYLDKTFCLGISLSF